MFASLLATSVLGFQSENNPIGRLDEELGRRRYFWGRGLDDDSDDWEADDFDVFREPLDEIDEDPKVIAEAVKDCGELKATMANAERQVQEWVQQQARYVHEEEKDARFFAAIGSLWNSAKDIGLLDAASNAISSWGRRRAGEAEEEVEEVADKLLIVVKECKKLETAVATDPETAEMVVDAVKQEAEARRVRNARELNDLIYQARTLGDRAERLLRAERSRY